MTSMAVTLSHTEGLKAVNRVKEATDRNPELVQLREALLKTDYRFTLQEWLEKYTEIACWYLITLSCMTSVWWYLRRSRRSSLLPRGSVAC